MFEVGRLPSWVVQSKKTLEDKQAAAMVSTKLVDMPTSSFVESCS